MENELMNNKSMNQGTKQDDIAIGKIPMQGTCMDLIPPAQALQVGTIFKELHKPFYLGGDGGGR